MRDESSQITGIFGIARNITARKQVEDKLKKAQNYISNIVDSMPSALIGVDANSTVTQWNREAHRASGLSPEKALGRRLDDVIPRLSAERDRVRQAMETRDVQRDSRRMYHKNGETYYEDITIYPLMANGIEGAVIRVDNITEQVRLEEMMVQSEKMLSVGGLAAGMAHEINNPLAGMVQTANNMSNRLTNMELPANLRAAEEAGVSMDIIQAFMESRDIPRMIATINESGRRVAEIVDNMLSFARKGEASTTTLDVEKLLDKALELAATDYDLKKRYDFKTIEIVKEYEAGLPFIPCEESKIQQVLLNILLNGARSMRELNERGKANKPRIVLRLAHEKDSEMVRIEIEDNGPGMDEATRRRVFEPFFTTKPVGEGTGLGMSVSYFIISENHGGTLDVASEPGQGANFIIRLPMKRTGREI